MGECTAPPRRELLQSHSNRDSGPAPPWGPPGSPKRGSQSGEASPRGCCFIGTAPGLPPSMGSRGQAGAVLGASQGPTPPRTVERQQVCSRPRLTTIFSPSHPRGDPHGPRGPGPSRTLARLPSPFRS